MRKRSLVIDFLEDGTVPPTFSVISLAAADTAGTLRSAIELANSTTGADVVNFAPNLTGVIALTGQIDIKDDVSIVGPGLGASGIEVNGNGVGRIFEVS